MYIRRKVFSSFIDENGEERYFSTTEFTDERLYSSCDECDDDTKKVEKKHNTRVKKEEKKYSEDGEKKMRWGDKQNIKRLKKMYEKDENIKEAHKKQYDDDLEVRKQGDKEVMKKGLKSVAKITGILVPASTAAGYGLSRGILKEGKKEALKTGGKMALASAGGAAAGAGIGVGAMALENKLRNKRVKEGKLTENDKRVKDQIKTAAGDMTEEEYTNKWGKTKKKK